MPRWRPLPEELDPQIREFTSQLRRLVDRSGMSVATVADRTGYSKSSWERYLGGRLLPPRGAIHALADVTDTDVRHLETMWELAERAWSRSEMRHDVTMEAIRVAQARAALGEFEEERGKGRKRGRNRDRDRDRDRDKDKDRNRDRERDPDQGQAQGTGAGRAGSEAAAGAYAAPHAPSVSEVGTPPGRPVYDDDTAVLRPRPLPSQGGTGGRGSQGRRVARSQQRVDPASWGQAGAGQIPGGSRSAARTNPTAPPDGPVRHPAPLGPARTGAGGPEPSAERGRRRGGMLLAAAVTVLVLIGAAVLTFGLPGGLGDSAAAPSASPSTTARDLPAGVQCQGKDCQGKDPEAMGCGGQHVKSTNSAFVGPSMVEVRYSKLCRAAWGRITGAAQGDSLKISAAGQSESDRVGSTNDAYTEMVAVSSGTEARACATLVAGRTGCTKAGSTAAPTASGSP